MTEYMNAP